MHVYSFQIIKKIFKSISFCYIRSEATLQKQTHQKLFKQGYFILEWSLETKISFEFLKRFAKPCVECLWKFNYGGREIVNFGVNVIWREPQNDYYDWCFVLWAWKFSLVRLSGFAIGYQASATQQRGFHSCFSHSAWSSIVGYRKNAGRVV